MIEKWVCEFCGLQLRNVVLPVRHRCKSRGLGDTVAKVLSSVGVLVQANWQHTLKDRTVVYY